MEIFSKSLEEIRRIVEEEKDEKQRESLLNSINSNGWNLLHLAAFQNRPATVSWLLSKDGGRKWGFKSVLARTSDKHRTTALHLACMEGRPEVMRILLNGCSKEEQKELLNAVDANGWTLLHTAIHFRYPNMVSWLLSSSDDKIVVGGRALGFNSVIVKSNDELGATALHFALYDSRAYCFDKVIEGLDENGLEESLNAVDANGWTLLHTACLNGHCSVVSWILSEEEGRKRGFSSKNLLGKTRDNRMSALYLAVASDRPEVVPTLLSALSVHERQELMLAIDSEHGWTALHVAARCGRDDAIRELVQYGECQLIANARDYRGMTALHRTIVGGIDEESRKEWQGKTDILLFCFPRQHRNAHCVCALLGGHMEEEENNHNGGDDDEGDEDNHYFDGDLMVDREEQGTGEEEGGGRGGGEEEEGEKEEGNDETTTTTGAAAVGEAKGKVVVDPNVEWKKPK